MLSQMSCYIPMKKLVNHNLEILRSGRWLSVERIRGYSIIFVASYLIAIVAWVFLSSGLRDHSGHPLGTDFLNVYA